MTATKVELGFLDGIEHPEKDRIFLEEFGDRKWTVNDSSLMDYAREAVFHGSSGNIAEIIETCLGGIKEGHAGMDLAGGTNGQALKDLLSVGILDRALLTNYEDRRKRRTQRVEGLDHFDGDIIRPETWRKIISWRKVRAPEGFGLIMHRPKGGLQDLPVPFYRGAVHLLIDMIKPGGLLFTQIPTSLLGTPQLTSLCTEVRTSGGIKRVDISRNRRYAVLYKQQ